MSEFLPPAATWSGQTGVFYRLLEGIDPEAYCLLSRVDFETVDYRGAPRRLPATYHHLGGAVTSSPEQRARPRALGHPDGGALEHSHAATEPQLATYRRADRIAHVGLVDLLLAGAGRSSGGTSGFGSGPP